MKEALVILILTVLAVGVESACDHNACNTTGGSCADYDNFIACLNGEKNGCTSSSPTGAELSIDLSLAGANLGKSFLGCGAVGMTEISVSTLFTSLLATFVKIRFYTS